jgi:lysophospholipase L1-like esterase
MHRAMAPPPRSSERRRITVALLICGGVFGGLVVAEFGLRLVARDTLMLQAQWGTPDDSVEKRARQHSTAQGGTFSYDEAGFRTGSGLPYDRSILFLGDSFTEGFGVSDDETFARATERALRRDGIAARSLNAGYHGFGAAQELKVLRRILARIAVDAVVVQSFPMNDLSDNIAFGGFGLADDSLQEYDPPRPPLRARLSGVVAQSWWLRDLYVVRLANNAILRGDPAAPFDWPMGFELEAALLRAIIASVGTRPLVVLVVPTRLVQEVQHGFHPDPRQLGEIRRFEQVCALMKESGVPWIDAGAVITDLAADAAKSDGGHFSRDGNTLIGEAIAQGLEPLLRAREPGGGRRSHPGA